MKNTMEYKGYIGTVEFSEEDGLFFGKVMGVRALISYEGENAKDLVSDFHGAVDDYLAECKAAGIEPERAISGGFNIHISPELHKKLVICATENHMTLNDYIVTVLRSAVSSVVI